MSYLGVAVDADHKSLVESVHIWSLFVNDNYYIVMITCSLLIIITPGRGGSKSLSSRFDCELLYFLIAIHNIKDFFWTYLICFCRLLHKADPEGVQGVRLTPSLPLRF